MEQVVVVFRGMVDRARNAPTQTTVVNTPNSTINDVGSNEDELPSIIAGDREIVSTSSLDNEDRESTLHVGHMYTPIIPVSMRRPRHVRYQLMGPNLTSRGNGVVRAFDDDEIDLTTLSSESETEVEITRSTARADIDGDDEVEIVDTSGGEVTAVQSNVPLSRKRRRRGLRNDAKDNHISTLLDGKRAESTSISMENNEAIERFKKSLKCSICLDIMTDMTSTICGHVYCRRCIQLAIRVTSKCPLCQRKLRPIDTHGLFF